MSIKIANYKIVNEIYKSTRSIIYKGVHCNDENIKVIIKTINSEYPSLEELARFEHEYRLLKRLNIHGVIKVLGLEKHGKNMAIIFEDFNAESLAFFIKDNDFKAVPLTTFYKIAISISKILGAIHHYNIIHKDINPCNILWNKTSEEIKIIDFGIATELSREQTTMDVCNHLEGSYPYISPEQTGRMNRHIDYRTDYYSLGITFFELLTGKRPFTAENPLGWVHAHLAKTPPNICELNKNLPTHLSLLINKLISKNAEDRYQSSYGIICDLEKSYQLFLETKNNTTSDNNSNYSNINCNFKLAEKDLSEKFQIPQKLYGRHHEVNLLIDIFEEVSKGATEFVLISGNAGVGKSVIVNEIQRKIVEKKGHFIDGKFDQYKINIPYLAVSQAFLSLTRQLLSESSDLVMKWKEKILDALQTNGKVILDIIPEMEKIIGPQNNLQKLTPSEAQHRFNLTFCNFIQALAQKEHPLVIFLDDLQWGDLPTITLIENILIAKRIKHLLLISAFRDNEIVEGHPLMLSLKEIEKHKRINKLNIKPLSEKDLNEMVADSLHCSHYQSLGLSKLIFIKTKGNPFFAKELMRNIYQHEYFNFSSEEGCWKWDMVKISKMQLSSDVVEFMSKKFNTLSFEVQQTLTFAACIGNTFDLNSLSIIMKEHPQKVATYLWEALREGVIIPLTDEYQLVQDLAEGEFNKDSSISTEDLNYNYNKFNVVYKFQHDRVQQAAYLMLPKENRKSTHLDIGRLLLSNISKEELNDKVIEIVRHLNEGVELVKDTNELLTLIKLNYQAGMKTKSATAYKSAFDYFKLAVDLIEKLKYIDHKIIDLDNDSDYELVIKSHFELAECAYICNEIELADLHCKFLFNKVHTKLEIAEIHSLQMMRYRAAGKMIDAIEAGMKGIKSLNKKSFCNSKAKSFSLLLKLIHVKFALLNVPLQELINRPILSDTELKRLMLIYSDLTDICYQGGKKELYLICAIELLILSLRHGFMAETSTSILTYGIVQNILFGNAQLADQYGKFALKLEQDFFDPKIRSKNYFLYSIFVHYWTHPMSETIPLFKKSIELSYQSGDTMVMGLCILQFLRFHLDWDIPTLLKEGDQYLNSIDENRCRGNWVLIKLFLQSRKTLAGKCKDICSLSDDTFNEYESINYVKKINYQVALTSYYIHQITLLCFFEKYILGLSYINEVKKYIHSSKGLWNFVDYTFFTSLTLINLYKDASIIERIKYRIQINRHLKNLKKWSKDSPDNFTHFHLLVMAEWMRVLKKRNANYDSLLILYQEAIHHSQKVGHTIYEALASELTGRYLLEIGLNYMAKYYLQDAYYIYLRYGANAKANQIKEKYTYLSIQTTFNPISNLYNANSTNENKNNHLDKANNKANNKANDKANDNENDNINNQIYTTTDVTKGKFLDLGTVIKASHVLSREIVLDKLLYKIIDIIMENAGANNGYLLLKDNTNNKLYISAQIREKEKDKEKDKDKNENNNLKTEELCDHNSLTLPLSIIHFIEKKHEDLVLQDVSTDNTFCNDPYVEKYKPKSVLCMPVINQGNFLGILYLENTYAPFIFTSDRIEIIKIILTQAAISIENAKWYTQLEEKVRERSEMLKKEAKEKEELQKKVHLSSRLAAIGELAAGICHEINNPLCILLGAIQKAKKLNLENALDRKTLNELSEKKMDMIERISSIVNRLKEYSSNTNLDNLNNTEKFNIHQMIEKTVDFVGASFWEQKINIDVELNSEVSEVLGNGAKFGQALMNILTNARDAIKNKNPDSGGTIEIKMDNISKLINGENIFYIKVAISDSGCGIEKENIDKIFDAFFTTKPIGRGTGLGLSMVHSIISEMGGEVDVESTLGSGSTFAITLPVYLGSK
ncbi:MAG: AAA family ATPase [Oligoflexia bacterium]|nr:AAA family ATPase [Oligoflexia bacterium]